MTKIHPSCKFTPRVYICTGVYIVHMNEALETPLIFRISLAGDKIQPWSIVHLMYVTYRCFGTPETTSDTLQEKSYIDLHHLTEKHNFFMTGIVLKISKHLYNEQSPKYPLTAHVKLDYVGKSSKRVTYRLYHNDVGIDYVSSICTDVLVSNETHRPVPYPEWWIKKFAPLCKNDRISNFALPKDRLQNPCWTSTEVSLSDTDIYKHTNTSNYIKFCCESIFKNISKKVYKKISQHHFDSGVKSLNITITGQSEVHDVLDIHTWEDSIDENTVYGQIVKRGGTTCCFIKIDFYNDNIQSLL